MRPPCLVDTLPCSAVASSETPNLGSCMSELGNLALMVRYLRREEKKKANEKRGAPKNAPKQGPNNVQFSWWLYCVVILWLVSLSPEPLLELSSFIMSIGSFVYPVLSVFALIISAIIVSDGVSGLKTANVVLTPIIVAVSAFALFSVKRENAVFDGVSFVSVFSYVGLNVFTSSIVFSELGETTNVKTTLPAVLLSSVTLGALIYLTLSAFGGANENVIGSDMPMVSAMSGHGVFKWIFYAVVLFGIFTTLLSSHYPLSALVSTKRLNFIPQTLLSVLLFLLSRLGFYNIVAFLYPIMGGIGIVYFIVTCFLQAVFRSARRKNTSTRQVYKV